MELFRYLTLTYKCFDSAFTSTVILEFSHQEVERTHARGDVRPMESGEKGRVCNFFVGSHHQAGLYNKRLILVES